MGPLLQMYQASSGPLSKLLGLKHIQRGDAYVLSDIVAWTNNRESEPKGIVVMNITGVLESHLK